ncbi:osteopetrosis-associated transmembrane protein 1-like [Oppia nitens]|uniref:osteopetrosis-associated transmembrane protein 1-like n=1 Tax=Oppia nitens TaxID=1686743 RepID=UPI0023DBCB76|nr:osteopetrosis-associated transmembrane protein 1-like [Oppia nitens]
MFNYSNYYIFLYIWIYCLRHGVNAINSEQSLTVDLNNYLKWLSQLNLKPNQTFDEDLRQKFADNSLAESERQLRHFLRADPSAEEAPTRQCQYVVFYFSLLLSQFVECLLINENPNTICLGCEQQFTDLYNGYKDLTNTSISNCSQTVIGSDKLNLIDNMYHNAMAKWKDGNCDSCFAGKNSSNHFVVNNDTLYYLCLTTDYMSCVNSTHNNSCNDCKQSFILVNDYYEKLSDNYSNHICNDIIDTMKDVRKQWSDILNCPSNVRFNSNLLVIVLAVFALPMVLYVTGRLFCGGTKKTIMLPKRLSTYHLRSTSESERLVQNQ